jgi:hypothetical protein
MVSVSFGFMVLLMMLGLLGGFLRLLLELGRLHLHA